MAADLEVIRAIAGGLPGVEERRAYGTPAWYVGKTFLGRMRDEQATLALRMDMDERDMLIEAAPAIFFLTDHYRGYPYVLICLAAIEPERLRRLFEACWRRAAPKRLLAAYDGTGRS